MPQVIKTRVTKTMNQHTRFCKLRVVLQTNIRLKN